MSDIYFCSNEARRLTLQRLTGPGAINGLDFLEVIDNFPGLPRQQILLVKMFRPLTAGQLKPANIALTGTSTTAVAVDWAYTATQIQNAASANDLPGVIPAELAPLKALILNQLPPSSPPTSPPTLLTDSVLVVRTDRAGDFAPYRLSLIASPLDPSAPPGFDVQIRFVDFTFKAACPTDIDCAEQPCPDPEIPAAPELDYLTKDYTGFRQLMLDRLAVVAPDLITQNPADLSVVLVELLAHAADKVSYLQDAVATEAYLGTARLRRSVRRHARLLDYNIGEGSNARTFIRFALDPTFPNPVTIPKGFMLLSSAVDGPTAINPIDLPVKLDKGAPVFETMHALDHASGKLNQLLFYTWGDDDCCLPAGATRATLNNTGGVLTSANLRAGDLLAFVELRGPDSGVEQDADPKHRHVVRLTKVTFLQDPLFNELASPVGPAQRVVDIEWSTEDALPFPLCLARVPATNPQPVSVVWGNIALADHGLTVVESPSLVVDSDPFRPTLTRGPIAWQGRVQDATGDAVLFDPAAPASSVFGWSSGDVVAAISIVDDGGRLWEPRRDLLESDGLSQHFVVETEEDGRVELRFGDGTLGREPTGVLTTTYRIGDAIEGNVGADMLDHFVISPLPLLSVTNPLPARGGAAPEPIEHVRINAPQAFRVQKRAVTEADYALAAEQHPDVQRAHAVRRFTGTWYTIFIAIDRLGGRPVDGAFRAEIAEIIEPLRMASHDFVIEAARFVPLEIVLPICVRSGFLPGDVRVRLTQAFSAGVLPDNQRGFFHPDNFTFGQPLYLSQVLKVATGVLGVASIDTSGVGASPLTFRRTDQPSKPASDPEFEGVIRVTAVEVIRVDNDVNQPQNGRINFVLQGGA
jgi:hypothetical protein